MSQSRHQAWRRRPRRPEEPDRRTDASAPVGKRSSRVVLGIALSRLLSCKIQQRMLRGIKRARGCSPKRGFPGLQRRIERCPFCISRFENGGGIKSEIWSVTLHGPPISPPISPAEGGRGSHRDESALTVPLPNPLGGQQPASPSTEDRRR